MHSDPQTIKDIARDSASARTKLLVSFGAAVAGGAAAAVAGAGRTAPLIGWDILALVFCGWVWSAVSSAATRSRRQATPRVRSPAATWPTS